MNLLKETLEIMAENHKQSKDVDFVNIYDRYTWDEIEEATHDWNWFVLYSDRFKNYDNGYGGTEVDYIEIVFKDGSWLERGEYDGLEWWDFKQTPKRIVKD